MMLHSTFFKKIKYSFLFLTVFSLYHIRLIAADSVQWIMPPKPEINLGGFYQAYWQGLYKLKKIDVQLVNSVDSQTDLKNVFEGKVQLGFFSSDEILLHAEKNIKPNIKVLFSPYSESSLVLISKTGNNLKPIKGIRDIWLQSGEFVDLKKNTSAINYFNKRYGPVKLNLLEAMDFNSFSKNPNYHKIGTYSVEPFLAQSSNVKINIFSLAKEGYKTLNNVLIVNESFAVKNPLVVKKIIEASIEGWNRYLKDPSKINARIFEQNNLMEVANMNRAVKYVSKLIRHYDGSTVGSLSKNRWTESYNQLKETGLIKKEFSYLDLLF